MAGEQLSGSHKIEGRTDVYGLASTFYELVAGRGPFVGDSQMEMMKKCINDDPPSLSELFNVVPSSLSRVLLGGLKKDPNERPDAETFANQLRELNLARPTLEFCSNRRSQSESN